MALNNAIDRVVRAGIPLGIVSQQRFTRCRSTDAGPYGPSQCDTVCALPCHPGEIWRTCSSCSSSVPHRNTFFHSCGPAGGIGLSIMCVMGDAVGVSSASTSAGSAALRTIHEALMPPPCSLLRTFLAGTRRQPSWLPPSAVSRRFCQLAGPTDLVSGVGSARSHDPTPAQRKS